MPMITHCITGSRAPMLESAPGPTAGQPTFPGTVQAAGWMFRQAGQEER